MIKIRKIYLASTTRYQKVIGARKNKGVILMKDIYLIAIMFIIDVCLDLLGISLYFAIVFNVALYVLNYQIRRL